MTKRDHRLMYDIQSFAYWLTLRQPAVLLFRSCLSGALLWALLFLKKETSERKRSSKAHLLKWYIDPSERCEWLAGGRASSGLGLTKKKLNKKKGTTTTIFIPPPFLLQIWNKLTIFPRKIDMTICSSLDSKKIPLFFPHFFDDHRQTQDRRGISLNYSDFKGGPKILGGNVGEHFLPPSLGLFFNGGGEWGE